MTSTADPGRRAGELAYRPARPDELGICAEVWRTSINDYVMPLGQHEIPPESNQVTRLFTHLQSTDPERFVVATRLEDGIERVVAFTSAVMRERLWYLSMLFVLPEYQGAGVGRSCSPASCRQTAMQIRSTATDSAQPISNALYASYGITPRMPLLNLVGYPERPAAFGPLPSGIVPVPFQVIASGPAAGDGHEALVRVDRRPRPRDRRHRPPAGPSIPANRGPPWLALPRSGRAADRVRLRRRVGSARTGRGPRSGPARSDPRSPGGRGHPARGVRDLDRRSSRSGAGPAAPGGLPARSVPRPALLGPPLRGLLALPPELPGPAVAAIPEHAAGRQHGGEGEGSLRQHPRFETAAGGRCGLVMTAGGRVGLVTRTVRHGFWPRAVPPGCSVPGCRLAGPDPGACGEELSAPHETAFAAAARRGSLVCRSSQTSGSLTETWLPLPCPRTESNRTRQTAGRSGQSRPRSQP